MKRLLLVSIILLSALPLFAEAAVKDDLTGKWTLNFYICEQPDGLLTAPEAYYSFPYSGITSIEILDGSFITILYGDLEYRALYSVEELDFDNLKLTCVFLDGREFTINLVKAGENAWKFLYYVSNETFPVENGPNEDTEDMESVMTAQTDSLNTDDAFGEEIPVEAELPLTMYAGIMEKDEIH